LDDVGEEDGRGLVEHKAVVPAVGGAEQRIARVLLLEIGGQLGRVGLVMEEGTQKSERHRCVEEG
jgi:hypothetical protein